MMEQGDQDKIRQEQFRQRAEVYWAKKLESWPTTCPVCFARPGQACFTKTGKRAVRHWHRER